MNNYLDLFDSQATNKKQKILKHINLAHSS